MKKNYLPKFITLGIVSLLIGGIDAQSTDIQRVWAKDANVLHDYYHWGSNVDVIQVSSMATISSFPVEQGVTQGVINAWNNCFLKFENVDFGTFTDSLTFCRNVPRGAQVEFWIDRIETTRFDNFFNSGGTVPSARNVIELSGGKHLGSYQHWYDIAGNWSRWEKIKIEISKVGGKHNLYVLFRAGGETPAIKNLGGLYYIDLHRKLNIEASLLSSDELNPTIPIGSYKLKYEVSPLDASINDLVWSTESGNDIVSVDNGVITGMKAGTATVKCVSSRGVGNSSLTFNITVVGTATSVANRIEAETAKAPLYNTFIGAIDQPYAVGELLESGVGQGLNYTWNTNFAIYEDVDFGSFTDSINFRHAEIRGGSVEFWIDRKLVDETNPQRGTTGKYKNESQKALAGGTFLGRYEFLKNETFTGGASSWKEFKLSIVPVFGIHDLYVVFLRGGKESGESDNQLLYKKTTGHWDWFELNRKITNIYQIIPSEEVVTMRPGDTKAIALQIVPEIVFDKNITWSVTDGSEQVSVDNTGKITANAVGVAKVRATSNADSNVYAEINVTVDTSTGISNTESVLTYNNPFNNTIQLHSKSTIENVSILDLSGRIVYKQYGLNNAELNIDSSSWNSGLYFILVKTTEGTKTLKITKQ